MVDKVVISNKSALQTKYKMTGFAALKKAVDRLISADAARGLVTQCIWIDDATEMKKFHGAPPVNPADERGNKAAIDAIANAVSPDYILLLDGPDVIPHIALDDPGTNDGDTTTDSDLPYASPSSFSRQIARYLKVTRVSWAPSERDRRGKAPKGS